MSVRIADFFLERPFEDLRGGALGCGRIVSGVNKGTAVNVSVDSAVPSSMSLRAL